MGDDAPRAIRSSHTLLIDDDERYVVLRSLASLIGDRQALILQQLHFLLAPFREGVELHGRYWMFYTWGDWQRFEFDLWHKGSIRRWFYELRDAGLVVILESSDAADAANGFTIDYAALERLYQGHPEVHAARRQRRRLRKLRTPTPAQVERSARALFTPPCANGSSPPDQSARPPDADCAAPPAQGARAVLIGQESGSESCENNNTERGGVADLLRAVEFANERLNDTAVRQLADMPGVCEDAIRDAIAAVSEYRGAVRNPLGLFRSTLERLIGQRPPAPAPETGDNRADEDRALATQAQANDSAQQRANQRLVDRLTLVEWADHVEAAIAELPPEQQSYLADIWRRKGKQSPGLVAAVAARVRAERAQPSGV